MEVAGALATHVDVHFYRDVPGAMGPTRDADAAHRPRAPLGASGD